MTFDVYKSRIYIGNVSYRSLILALGLIARIRGERETVGIDVGHYSIKYVKVYQFAEELWEKKKKTRIASLF